MASPLSNLVPGPIEPAPKDVEPVTLSIDKDNLEWLDAIAERTGRKRSDVVRQILTPIRLADQEQAAATAREDERRQSERRVS